MNSTAVTEQMSKTKGVGQMLLGADLSPAHSVSGPSVDFFDNIVTVQRSGFSPVGFHARNLEVASLSPQSIQDLHAGNAASEALSELRAWSESENPNVRPGTIKFGARNITINVTQICNLHCTYCAAGGDGTFGDPIKKISVENTLPQLKSLLEKVPAGKKFHVTFLGGEPLLYPEGVRLLAEYVRGFSAENNIFSSFTVVTNGTLFTPANIQLLCDLQADLTISIDGPAVVNDKTRPNRGGLGVTDKVVAGIHELLKRKSELGAVEISGVFGKRNMNLMRAYEFYRSFNVDSFDFTYDHLEVSADVNAAYTAALTEVADRAFEEEGEAGLRRIKYFDKLFELLDNQQQVQNYCGAGKSYFMIDARNGIYTCPWVAGDKDEIVGHGERIWTEKLKNYQTPLVEANGCGACWARNLCGGGCMFIHKNRTGSKNKVDDNFCNRTKDLIALGLLYYERARSEGFSSEKEAL